MKINIIWLVVIVAGIWLGIEFAANLLGDWVFYGAGIVIAGLLGWTHWQTKNK